MDKFNNGKGIEAAQKLIGQKNFSQEAIEKEALRGLHDKTLNVLSPSRRIPEWKN
jgi:hypothetical protein